jgi:hypothetical protein
MDYIMSLPYPTDNEQ